MSNVNFLAEYLGDIQSYLDIVKEDYTETLPVIEIQRIEKDKLFFRAEVNANDPNHQEVVNEFREDIAGFLDKYIDEDEVNAEENKNGLRWLSGWHTHPNNSANPSEIDNNVMFKYANSEKANLPEAILLIVGGNSKTGFDLSLHLYTKEEKLIFEVC